MKQTLHISQSTMTSGFLNGLGFLHFTAAFARPKVFASIPPRLGDPLLELSHSQQWRQLAPQLHAHEQGSLLRGWRTRRLALPTEIEP